jgi:hypothetical protein
MGVCETCIVNKARITVGKHQEKKGRCVPISADVNEVQNTCINSLELIVKAIAIIFTIIILAQISVDLLFVYPTISRVCSFPLLENSKKQSTKAQESRASLSQSMKETLRLKVVKGCKLKLF